MTSEGATADDVKTGNREAVLAEAIRYEHELTFLQAVKLYPAAIGWSAFVSLGVIMLAFDPQLIGNLFAIPQFQRDFGYKFGDGYIISAPWQTGLVSINPTSFGFCLTDMLTTILVYGKSRWASRWRFGRWLPDGHVRPKVDFRSLCRSDSRPHLLSVLCPFAYHSSCW